MSERKIQVLLLGAKVHVDDLEMTVIVVRLAGSSPQVDYECAWWVDGGYRTAQLDDFQVEPSSDSNPVGFVVSSK